MTGIVEALHGGGLELKEIEVEGVRAGCGYQQHAVAKSRKVVLPLLITAMESMTPAHANLRRVKVSANTPKRIRVHF